MSNDPSDPNDLLRGPSLCFLHGDRGFRVRMSTPRLVVGRGGACDVVLPEADVLISRRHLLLQRRGRRVLATNLGRHAARMNDRPLEDGAHELSRGDRLQVGGWSIAVEEPGRPTAPTTAPRPRPGEPSLRPTHDHGLVGMSAATEQLRAEIDRLAPLDVPVLILGETGSGKERVARALHDASPRRAGGWVAVNCGALLGDTARSELFGHVRGAFTGAERPRAGAFVEADGDTVFLDEIGELSGELQAALLRTLDLGEVVPVGSVKPLRPDVRVVAATHRDLHGQDGPPHRYYGSQGFRQDLLYRLDVAQIRVPPLRDRPDDVAPLARHFLEDASLGPAPTLHPDALQALLEHRWPGNVRELRNCLLRATVASGGGPILRSHVWLRPPPQPHIPHRAVLTAAEPQFTGYPGRRDRAPAPGLGPDTEREGVMRALARSGGNRTQAARSLGVARSTLYERMRRHGLMPDLPDEPQEGEQE